MRPLLEVLMFLSGLVTLVWPPALGMVIVFAALLIRDGLDGRAEPEARATDSEGGAEGG